VERQETKVEKRAHSLDCLSHNLAGEIQRRLQQRQNQGVLVVGIGGYTSLGKTSLAERLVGHFNGDLTILPTDSFLLDRARRQQLGTSGNNPRHIDFEGMVGTLRKLKSGETTEVRSYDHTLGRYSATVRLSPADIIILDGTSSLYPNIRGNVDLAVFLDADEKILFSIAEIVHQARNYTEVEFEQFWRLFQCERKLFIEPTKRTVDHVVGVANGWFYSTELINRCQRLGCSDIF